MPPVNIYYRNPEHKAELIAGVLPLKEHVAAQLSAERTLTPEDVSVRLIEAVGDGMLAEVELDIIAAASPKRIDHQDEICTSVRKHVLEQHPSFSDAKVWLSLSELGYSFDS